MVMMVTTTVVLVVMIVIKSSTKKAEAGRKAVQSEPHGSKNRRSLHLPRPWEIVEEAVSIGSNSTAILSDTEKRILLERLDMKRKIEKSLCKAAALCLVGPRSSAAELQGLHLGQKDVKWRGQEQTECAPDSHSPGLIPQVMHGKNGCLLSQS